jgi:hypothetical protein
VVAGVAYTLSTSRGFVDRFALAREALARAEQRLEELQYPPAWQDTVPGVHVRDLDPPLAGRIPARERLEVSYLDDPADDFPPPDPSTRDYKRIQVTISWTAGFADTVTLQSYYAVK